MYTAHAWECGSVSLWREYGLWVRQNPIQSSSFVWCKSSCTSAEVCVCVWKRHAKVPCCVGLRTSWWKFHITSSAQHGWNRWKKQIKHKLALNMREFIYIWNKKLAKLEYEKHENVSPESSLVFQQSLQSHQPLFSLRPVSRGTSIEHFGHVLSLPHIRRNAAISGAVRTLWTCAGGVAICIIVWVHPIGVIPPPSWFLLLRKM